VCYFCRTKVEFGGEILIKAIMENFTKIRRMGAEMWTQTNEGTDRRDEDSNHFS